MTKWGRRFRKLLEHPRPVRAVASRVLWHAGLSRFFLADLHYGIRIRFYPSSVSAGLWSDPRARNEDADFVWTVLREGDRSIDAGANIGHLTLVASRRVGSSGEVLAIEAHPEIFGYLEGNLALNRVSNVRATECALGAETGEVAFTSRRSDDQNFISSDGTVRVPMRTLDDVVEPGQTRLLKLDVEGYELPVLRGAQRTLSSTQIVYCELTKDNCRRFGYEPEEIERFLLDQGFVFVRRDSADGPRVTGQAFYAGLPAELLPATGYNLIAARPEVADEVASLLSGGPEKHGPINRLPNAPRPR
jgi:FkbM family methyltransferase